MNNQHMRKNSPQHIQMSCPRCRLPMKFRALQHVDDPRRGGLEVEVFECSACGRLSAEAEAVAKPAALH